MYNPVFPGNYFYPAPRFDNSRIYSNDLCNKISSLFRYHLHLERGGTMTIGRYRSFFNGKNHPIEFAA